MIPVLCAQRIAEARAKQLAIDITLHVLLLESRVRGSLLEEAVAVATPEASRGPSCHVALMGMVAGVRGIELYFFNGLLILGNESNWFPCSSTKLGNSSEDADRGSRRQ
jgi:hypothetical protein